MSNRKNFLIGAILHQTGILAVLSPIFYYLGFSENDATKRKSLIALISFYGGSLFLGIGLALQYLSYITYSTGMYYTGLVFEILGPIFMIVTFYEYYIAAKIISEGIAPKLILLGLIAPIIVVIMAIIAFAIIVSSPEMYGLAMGIMYTGFFIGFVFNILCADGFLLLYKD